MDQVRWNLCWRRTAHREIERLGEREMEERLEKCTHDNHSEYDTEEESKRGRRCTYNGQYKLWLECEGKWINIKNMNVRRKQRRLRQVGSKVTEGPHGKRSSNTVCDMWGARIQPCSSVQRLLAVSEAVLCECERSFSKDGSEPGDPPCMHLGLEAFRLHQS